jgi:isopentenyldiphosphate isomerase
MKILLKLLPGLLPLIVYILIDSILPSKTAIAVAISFGILQFLIIGIVKKQWDKFIILDTALLALLGGVSIVFDNEFFFLWKPAIIEALMVILLTIVYFTNINIIFKWMGHYMDIPDVNEEQTNAFRRSLFNILILFILHIALIIFSIYNLSREWWAFISGVLLYIIMGIWLIAQLAINKLNFSKKRKELVPVLNDQLQIINVAPRDEVHNGSKILHPVVHLYVFNNEGKLLLQKRGNNKLIQPGKWDASVGGHISYNEKPEEALFRESKEEIGLKKFKPELIHHYIWESEIERELVFIFITSILDQNQLKLSKEVSELRWWTKKEISSQLGKNFFTPNLEFEFQNIISKFWE